MSVGFTDKDESHYIENYRVDSSELGKVYYPKSGVIQTGEIAVIYDVKPWMSSFKVEGLKPDPELKIQTLKTPEEFVASIAEIYPAAYDEHKRHSNAEGNFDAEGFFKTAHDWFMTKTSSTLRDMYRGFLENAKSEGNEEMQRIVENL